MQAISLFMQCFGSALVGPLLKKVPLRNLLSCSIFFFGLVMLSVPILEFSTGSFAIFIFFFVFIRGIKFVGGIIPGRTKNATNHSPETWGHWNPLILYAVVSLAGIFYGIVELIRRVLPCSIVGSDVEKLRKLDSIIHIGINNDFFFFLMKLNFITME